MYAVIATYDWGLDGQSTEIAPSLDNAAQLAAERNRQAAGQATVHYRVYALQEISDDALLDWGVRQPNGHVLAYVNEAAARRCAADATVVCRMPGETDWQDASR